MDGSGAGGGGELQPQKSSSRRSADDAAAEAAAAEFDDDDGDGDGDSLDGDMPGEVEMDKMQPRAQHSTLAIVRTPHNIDNPHSEGNRFISNNKL